MLSPVQQPVLSLQLTDFGQVLADFQGAPVIAFFIPNCKIADIDELLRQLDPEFGRVPGAGFERIQDFIDLFFYLISYY